MRDTANASIGCAVKDPTTLERCRELQEQNLRAINQISGRVVQMLERLNGGSPERSEAESLSPTGVLNEHQRCLELESQRLGELEADLAALSRLL
jgi:hypothetical protein